MNNSEREEFIKKIKKYENPPEMVRLFSNEESDTIFNKVLETIKDYEGNSYEFKDKSLTKYFNQPELKPFVDFILDRFSSHLKLNVKLSTSYLFFSNSVPVTIHTDGGVRNGIPVFKSAFLPLHIKYNNGVDYFTNDNFSIEKNVATIGFHQRHYFERIFITYGCDEDVSDVKIPTDVCVSDKWWEVIEDSFDDFRIDEKVALREFSDSFRGDLEQIKKHFRGFSIQSMFPNKKGHVIFFDNSQFHTSGSFINKNATEKYGIRFDLRLDNY